MTVASSRSSKLDSFGRSSPYVWDMSSPGKKEAELAPTGRRPLIALRRPSQSGVQTLQLLRRAYPDPGLCPRKADRD